MARQSPHYGATVQVGNWRVEAAHLSYMATVLRSHGNRKRILHDLEEGVIKATPATDTTGMPRGSGPSDPTAAAAERLQDEREPSFKSRAHLRTMINSVEQVYKRLPADERQIVDWLYVTGDRTLVGAALALHMSKSTVVRKRNRALLTLALHLIGDDILLPLTKT